MDLLDRLLEHDAWTTKRILEICATLSDEQLDREFDIGHRSLRLTLDHVIHNIEVWTSLMVESQVKRVSDLTVPGMTKRLEQAHARFAAMAREIAATDSWDNLWWDHLDSPARQKSFGTAIAHVITHNMHHRAQLLYMLRMSGIAPLPEGDVFSWEAEAKAE